MKPKEMYRERLRELSVMLNRATRMRDRELLSIAIAVYEHLIECPYTHHYRDGEPPTCCYIAYPSKRNADALKSADKKNREVYHD